MWIRMVFAGLAAWLAIAPASAQQPFRFVAIGDMPYGEAAKPRFERLIARINALKPAFTVHIGDIISGREPCVDAVYLYAYARFSQVDGPLIYTPGDNEWTDCHRHGNAHNKPDERLHFLRKLFFANTNSLGKKPLPLERQSAQPVFAPYVENATWRYQGVRFATLHVVGSANNSKREPEEYAARNRADLAWLTRAFASGRKESALGLVLFMHADPRFDKKKPGAQAGFTDFLEKLRSLVADFPRPVLLVHGDTHQFRVDQPLFADPANRKDLLDRFFRLEVFGAREVHGVEVTVDPARPALFSFRPVMVF